MYRIETHRTDRRGGHHSAWETSRERDAWDYFRQWAHHRWLDLHNHPQSNPTTGYIVTIERDGELLAAHIGREDDSERTHTLVQAINEPTVQARVLAHRATLAGEVRS